MKYSRILHSIQKDLLPFTFGIFIFSVTYFANGADQTDFDAKHSHVLSLIEENDALYNPMGAHQDRHYTQGLKLIYLEGGDPWWAKGLGLVKLSEQLPNFGINPTSASFGLTAGQNIYTPENNLATNLIRSDRPYAGWAYVGFVIQQRGEAFGNIPVLESFELDIGVIGPEAQAGRSQNDVHDFGDIPGFDGWGNQLRTEVAFVLKYGRAWKLAFNEKSGHYFDVIPHIGANLGTLMISANAGATMRLGFNLPDNFGVQIIDSPITLSPAGAGGKKIGAYLFGTVDGRAVGRNAFLDGNLFTDSFHVDKEPFVGDLRYGVAFAFGEHFDLSYTRIVRTREFELQKGYDRFGSLAANFKWGF